MCFCKITNDFIGNMNKDKTEIFSKSKKVDDYDIFYNVEAIILKYYKRPKAYVQGCMHCALRPVACK